MCSAKWEMTSLKSTDVLERISCSIANMTLEQILLCIFFLISNRKLFFFVKFLFSIFLGLWYNNVNFCYRCSMILLYSKYIQRANQKCSSYFDLMHVCCKLMNEYTLLYYKFHCIEDMETKGILNSLVNFWIIASCRLDM